ncbi:hypothetical protein H6F43_03855 [Leptolyngbya sp. FACHB-36]|uniref:M12 family metallo-peptidase n=1 Tax=Leptolyngbya sp. FACHB-36 TaxID=2692808 RepID=UPI00168175C3|nr:M12 family metallo-peptidase [Leptolyngbya sp. FACHB-36]MBD2019317.1 hypothetical protein [Leptolyngbya sp. FACHB-36]
MNYSLNRFFLTLFFILVLFLAQGSVPAQAQVQQEPFPNLFSFVAEENLLSNEQTTRLKSYQSDPTAAAISVVRIEVDLLRTEERANLNLAKNLDVPLDTIHIEERTPQSYSWFGRNSATEERAILTIQDNVIIGAIDTNRQAYEIRPLGDDLHVLIQINEAALPEDHPPDFQKIENQLNQESVLEQSQEVSEDAERRDDGSIITVLVAYTHTAKDQTQRNNIPIDQLVQNSVDLANESYGSSEITPRLQLIHTYETSYTEVNDLDTDLENFADPKNKRNTNSNREVKRLRDQYAADVVILLIRGDGGFCGLAWINAVNEKAFGVVRQDCAARGGQYSFAHEVGHIQGARHNIEEDPKDVPYRYGHGYCYPPGGWRTIMSYDNCGSSTSRKLFWSNPNQRYPNNGGAPRGTATRQNNTRVLNQTASKVANFRSSQQ